MVDAKRKHNGWDDNEEKVFLFAVMYIFSATKGRWEIFPLSNDNVVFYFSLLFPSIVSAERKIGKKSLRKLRHKTRNFN